MESEEESPSRGKVRLQKYLSECGVASRRRAEALIERLLFLDATPSLTEPMQINVGKSVKEQLQSDLKLEVGKVGPLSLIISRSVTSPNFPSDGLIGIRPDGW